MRGEKIAKVSNFFFVTIKQKVEGIKCWKIMKIKISLESEIANCLKEGKIHLKIHLIEEKSCNFLQQLRNKAVDGECKIRPISNFKLRKILPLGIRNKKKKVFLKKLKIIFKNINFVTQNDKTIMGFIEESYNWRNITNKNIANWLHFDKIAH